ncbi:MAG: MATE family efflux transporter [Oscillospiraceae bacterium]|nr:MATE family efflux transporter [Oscillospiraceae bacterium]
MNKFENNMSQGSVLKNLVLFSLPFLASNLIQSLYNVADMLIVGNFGGVDSASRVNSMSGVNIGGQVTFILTNIVIGFCMGATVLIGQYIGAQKRDELKKVISTILTMLIALAAIFTTLMLIFKRYVLDLLQTPPESYLESDRYLSVTLTGVIFIFAYNALSAILRGMGDSKTPFYFVTVACFTNIVLDLIFVAGFDQGAFGAALATVIAQALSVVLCVIYIKKRNFQFDFKLSSFKIYKDQLSLIVKIGLPTSVQNGIVSLSFLFLTGMVNTFGVAASAAVGAVGKFNSFVFMPITAISSSVSTISAQNIGANRLDRAVSVCKLGVGISFCIGALFFVIVRIFPEAILSIFGDDAKMIENGIIYFSTFSFDLLIIPFIFCINGLFIGGGHTLFSLVTGMFSSVLLRVPACYIFGIVFDWGLAGVGMGAPVASAGSLLIITGFLVSGRWKQNVVHNAINIEM